MKLKKFNQYIKEDYSNVYDIENPVMGDGDDLSTPEDESDMPKMELELISDETSEIRHSEEGGLNIKMEFSKLDKETLQKIAMGEIDAGAIAKEILDSCDDDDEECIEDDETEVHGDLEDELGMGGEELGMGSEELGMGGEDISMMGLSEMLNFKNFKKRK